MSSPLANSTTSCRSGDLYAWALTAGMLLTAALAGPAFFGRIYTQDDLGCFHLPIRAFYAEQLVRDQPFDWMPSLFCGFYLTGEGQAGVYHPWHWGLYRLLPLPSAWTAELLASYLFLMAGVYRFLHGRRLRPDAAMFGSLAFTFCSFNLLHLIHPNAVAIVAHIPWLLWTIDLVVQRPIRSGDCPEVRAARMGLSPSRPGIVVVAIAGLTASQFLLGYPQYVWFSLLVEGGYLLFVWRDRHSPGFAPNGILRLGAAKLLGLALGAVQLLPTIDALAHSTRRATDAAFTNFGSIHPLNVIQWVAPYLFRNRVVGQNTPELSLYLGAAPLMLIVWLWIERKQLGVWRRPVLAALVLGGLGLLLATGSYGQVYRLQRLLPLVGSFRCPCRYSLLFHFAMCVLAAIGFLVLARRQERGDRIAWRVAAPLAWLVGLSTLAVPVCLAAFPRSVFGPWPGIVAGPLLIGVAALLVVAAARGSRTALVGLILLTAADLGYYGLSKAYPYAETLRRFQTQAAVARPPSKLDGRIFLDVDHEAIRTGNALVMLGYLRADGYAGLMPGRELDYHLLAALRAAQVSWVRQSQAAASIQGLSSPDRHWLGVPDPLARVRLVAQAQVSQAPAREIATIRLETTALVESPVTIPPGPHGFATLVSDRPGHLHVHVDAPAGRLLVVSESYHAGWQASVDGQPAPVLRVNGDFFGCVVPAGKHEVRLDFHPASLRYGKYLSLASLILLMGIAIFWKPGSSAATRP